jgi:phosphatidate cytidylyltransferase
LGIFNVLFLLAILVISAFVLFFFVLNNTYSFSEIAIVLASLIYIPLPLALSMAINFADASSYNPYFMIAVFALIWANDTGAYLTGIAIGKHKIWPSISPKKTWEGFIGGLLVSIVIAFVLNKWAALELFSFIQLLGLALITGLFGVFGDFIESAIKRNANIKDSGNLLPGHGGILDRIDSLLCVSPFVFIYLQCLPL